MIPTAASAAFTCGSAETRARRAIQRLRSAFRAALTASAIGIASGSQFPSPPSSLSPAPLLGYSLMGLADVGTDLLPAMGQAPGALGFVGPLGAGSYTVWAQETSLSIDQWGLDLVVTAVPAPGALAVIGLGGIVFRRRRG